MKKAAFKTMTVLIVFSCLLSNTSESAETLDIASIYKPPISNFEETGMADLVVREAFSRIGVKIHIVPADSATALEKVNKGLYDGDLMRVAGANQKYPNVIQIPEPLFEIEFSAFSNTVNSPMSGYEGLKPYRVAVPKGWIETDNNVKEENVKSVFRIISPFDMFNTLLKGDADIVIYHRLMGYEMIKEMGASDKIHVLEPPMAVRPYFFWIHKKHQDLVPKLDAAIKDMKKDGTIQKIVAETLGKYKK
jgi:polar amino acid transport system substrate-binding protein